MIVERIENWRARFAGPVWARVFECVEKLGPDSPEGETKIQGDDIILRVMSYPTREPEDAVLESHRKYIDIQTALVESERIDWFPAPGLEIKTPYDAETDVVFYERPGGAPASIDVHPGTFVVLFAPDAHMPQLASAAGPCTVKKAVVKLNHELLGE